MVDQSALNMIRETDNASALLASDLVALSTRGWSISDHAATFTDLASGAERLMKLSAGFAHLEDSGQWLQVSGYGHRILRLKGDVDTLLAARTDQATHPAYIRTLTERVNEDPALPLIFQTLDAWAATSGRYGALDAIAGRASSAPSVEDLWGNAERAARTPEILAGLSDPSGSALTELRGLLAASLLRWWWLIFRAWAHGMFGRRARQLSSQIDPRRPPALEPFARRVLDGL